ncbi:kinesin-like protein KIF16B [Saccostrea echinata]|uniref:kinesin-like protein KIF16B n=1 Tax=Saccostrea echinata TaxID=191078 RepID=UPI002A8059AA|nr:kinesin-like protein KIF16B [Saccostrea echinata]
MTSVKVAVRVRPINQREHDLDSKFIIQMDGRKTTITNLKIPEHLQEGDSGRELMRHKEFTFDFSFWSVLRTDPHFASQEQVFKCLGVDVVTSAYDGYNACVFAYGQTGSGKSYTMMGNPGDQGLIPRICENLFSKMTDEDTNYRTEVSYLEIYNEKVRDLLKQQSPNKAMHNLRVREHPIEGPYVQDLSKHVVSDFSDIKDLMDRGNSIRTTASTNMNDVSSRSHAIFTIVFTQAKFSDDMPCEMSSKIHLVDLAGSERADASGATGQRLKEGASINKSLVTLGSVISVLADISTHKHEKKTFIPYRDSVLTWLLKDSLGGNSRTIMIATISPADVNYAETLSTLRYANRAKNIINRPTVNEDPNVRLIRELREEIARLKAMMGGNIDSISTPKVQEKLHENEARVKVLTEEWAGKWNEAAKILKDQNVAVRREGMGVVLDSKLPHLIGIDDDILSTGIMLYHLKEGRTSVGRGDAEDSQDIVIAGVDVERYHCWIENTDGEVTLYPVDDALCAVNGNVINEPTKLTQGAVILLGKTNMFRYNNPAEAEKLKSELKNCGLSLSRTSLLSKSMSDLYRSTENLSLMSVGFELEQARNEDLQKIEEKRLQINLLEKKYSKAEEERQSKQSQLERDLEEKQYELQRLEISLQKKKQQLLDSQKHKTVHIDEMLKELDEKEKKLREEAQESIKKLKKEIKVLQESGRQKTASQQEQIDQLVCEESAVEEEFQTASQDLQTQITAQQNSLSKSEKLAEENQAELSRVQEEFNSKRDTMLEQNGELKNLYQKEHESYLEANKQFRKEEEEMKSRWQRPLEDIAGSNQTIEEAWHDLREHEEELRKKLNQCQDNEERDQLLVEQDELEKARELLKEEEEITSHKEKLLLDQIEREMEKFEENKDQVLGELALKRDNIVVSKDENLCHLHSALKEREKIKHKLKREISHSEHEVEKLKTSLKSLCEDKDIRGDEIKQRKRSLQENMASGQKSQELAVMDLKAKVVKVEENLQEELCHLKSERERLLKQKSSEVNITDTEDPTLQCQLKEVEDLKAKLELTEQELEERWKMFDEQRNAELDKIEFERLKLQELEHQERINALVEQEVKRRLFEEKKQRENLRKQEREKERQERDLEIQKLKEQHSREIKQLKAKFEADQEMSRHSSMTSLHTRSNPYGSGMSPSNGSSTDQLSRARSSSSVTGTGSYSGSFLESFRIRISIPTYRLHGYGSDTHYEYEVKIAVDEDVWSIYRRYSRFRQLHQDMKKKFPEVSQLAFPPRKILFSRSDKVVAERRKLLELYLRGLISIFLKTPSCPLHSSLCKQPTKQDLCEYEPFFKRGLFETGKHSTT